MAPVCASRAAQAQVPLARLTQIQQKVEIRSGAAGAYRSITKIGTAIARGDVIRTGRRSKADVKFGDGSLVRLGQLSSVEVRGPRQVQVAGGSALISWLSPGKIGTSYAAAEIKGTIVNVSVNDAGATFTLYEGATDIVTDKGRQTLKPGTEVTAKPDGTLSGLRTAAPIFFAQAGAQLDLLDSPKNGAFTGSAADVIAKSSPANVVQRETATNAQQQQIVTTPGLPVSATTPGKPPEGPKPPKEPKPPKPPKEPKPPKKPKPPKEPKPPKGDGGKGDGGKGDGGKGDGGKGDGGKGDGGKNELVLARAESGVKPGTIGALLARQASSTSGASGALADNRVLLAQIMAPDAGQTDALKTADVAQNAFDSKRAQQRVDELSGAGGKSAGFDARAIGVLGDGGTYAYGARLRGYLARGNYLLDGAVQPLRVRANNQSFDLSAISDLSLTYRSPTLEVQAGRQRFLSGPTQATLYGSLVRQGGREIMDAVRVAAPFSSRTGRLEAAYLVDAYPRNLPYKVGGLQQGFYARYSQQKKLNLGLNAIKYFNLDRSNQVGASLDFALPLATQRVNLYGEFGRDTFGRTLSTLGLSFPGLYARSGFDLYLEAAYLSAGSNAPRPPAEFALRAYRHLNDNVDLVGSLSRFSNGETSALLGVSVGSKLSR